ncbi:non-specific lipid transfer protein GPI-anchored 10 [Daucus carota subsp. sativus]|uniref:non-specific lipid transfer protein GPI-anchored 10 n=1 Tax=Daucus carota subsp. sativus TaxID=79200 RepID=UPI0007F01ECD|nr:PREDICTED: protein YLS3 [Daucus carota subsp. sativus]
MAFPHRRCHPTTTHMLFLIFLSIASTVQSQNSSSGPSISQCGTGLMPLAPCAPFVQGRTSNPGVSCCVNLRQVYDQQTACLCLLLNETTLSSIPINQTLALQLPALCNLQVDRSTCSEGTPLPPSPPPPTTSPDSQVSFGSNSNSTVAASPMVMVNPRSSILGFRSHNNDGTNLKPEIYFWLFLMSSVVSITFKTS